MDYQRKTMAKAKIQNINFDNTSTKPKTANASFGALVTAAELGGLSTG
jgi:hypothetical protein